MSLEVWLALVALFGIGGLTPGPAVMLVMASSFRYGFKPAMLPALGIASANVIWLLLAASGAAALATSFPKAFLALKIIGVLVILYLALTAIFGPLPDSDANAAEAPPQAKLYSFRPAFTGLFRRKLLHSVTGFYHVYHGHNHRAFGAWGLCLWSPKNSPLAQKPKTSQIFQYFYWLRDMGYPEYNQPLRLVM